MNAIKIAIQIQVTIDDVNEVVAWTFDEVWNEWSEPYFEKTEADKVAKIHNCTYDKVMDSFRFEQGGNVEEFKALEIQTLDGAKKVYAIGTGSWIWDVVEWVEN